MKNNRLHIVLVFCGIVLSTLLMDSCKPKKQEIPPFIEVHLDVKDDKNQPIDSATVYLYDSKEAFDAAYANSLKLIYNSTGATLTTKIVNGAIDLKDLPSNKEYWVLVHDASESFKDAAGKELAYKIDKDNSEANYKIDGFQNGTIVTANIKLSPVTSLVTFSNNFLISNFSRVEIGGDKINNFSPTDYRRVRKGDVSYMARTEACVWTGAIEAVGGKVVTEPLVACNYGMVTFTYPNDLLSGQVVSIYIGQNKDKSIATIIAPNKSATIILPVGSNYSYFTESIVSGKRECVYEGVILSVTNTSNIIEPIKVCN